MTDTIRVVFEHGLLRPLDPVDLREGQEVQVTIVSERERVRAALSDILVPDDSDRTDEEDAVLDALDEDVFFAEMDSLIRGSPSASEMIIEERRNGP